MLNHAIDNLTTAQEDAYLTTALIGFTRQDVKGRRCHLGILDLVAVGPSRYVDTRPGDNLLAPRFNALCIKLEGKRPQWVGSESGREWVVPQLCENGAARLGVLIRNRILANRARRILQNAPTSRDTEVDAQTVGACRFGRGE